MKQVTKLMINEFHIDRLNYDFMGYSLERGDVYTFHHLIVPNREGGRYVRWNGAILCGKTSHPYLHTIEDVDLDMFRYLTGEMIDMNVKGYLDTINLHNIGEALNDFEREHCADRTKKGKMLIKEQYTRRCKF